MGSTRVKWRDRTPENDIKYGGSLSYRHLRIIAWFCLVVAQVAVILKLEVKLAPDTAKIIEGWNFALTIIGGLPVPLFLLANLSTILQKRGNFKALFIKFGALALGLYILANFVVFHYGFRTMHALDNTTTWADAARVFGELLPLFGKTGYTLNIFIDMLLVVLMFYFANYQPNAKIFQGKRIALFRALIILPIAYEVVAIFIKYHISMGNFILPSPVFFLLPSKPPLIFGAFVVIVVALKLSEVAYLRRKGNTKEKFEAHLTTRAHSLKISIGISVVFAIFAILDLALLLGLSVSTVYKYQEIYKNIYTEEQIEMLISYRIYVFEAIGFGGSTGLILIIPLVLLFSYTKTHKNPKIDILIPIGGIALIAIVLLEGTFQVLTLNLASFMDKLRQFINDAAKEDGGGTTPAATMLLSWVQNIHI